MLTSSLYLEGIYALGYGRFLLARTSLEEYCISQTQKVETSPSVFLLLIISIPITSSGKTGIPKQSSSNSSILKTVVSCLDETCDNLAAAAAAAAVSPS